MSAGCAACLVCARAWCATGEKAETAVHSSSATLPTLRIASISFASTCAAEAEGSDPVPTQNVAGVSPAPAQGVRPAAAPYGAHDEEGEDPRRLRVVHDRREPDG